MTIYNMGCGQNKIPGAINVDVEPGVKPDVVMDFTKPLPIASDSVDKIYFFHVIEHIPEAKHRDILSEFRRVLKSGGLMTMAYPEFSTCAKHWLENHLGERDFWKATLYGRQLYPSDYHVALMHTPDFLDLLKEIGFTVIVVSHEPGEDFNTVLRLQKCEPMMTYEDVLRQEIFGE